MTGAAATRRLPAVTALAAVLALAGCAAGVKHAYTGAAPDLKVSGNRVAIVAVRDARPYVLSGYRPPDFVGLSRGGFGNPYDILTESGNPLAVDFGTTIAAGLRAKGFKATVLEGDVPDSPAGIAAAMKKAGAERMVVVILVEWMSDVYLSGALIYDLSLRVYGSAGNEMGATRLSGREILGSDAVSSPDRARAAVPVLYRQILGQLFSAQPIVSDLQ
jgi:hypothetical protein